MRFLAIREVPSIEESGMSSELRLPFNWSRPHADAAFFDDRSCKICDGKAFFFGTVDFSKNCQGARLPSSGISVNFYQCALCDLLFTDFCDDWGSEEYTRFVYNEDYLIVDPEYDGTRAARTAHEMLPRFESAGKQLSLLDFGAGAGGFAQALRDAGFARVVNYDPYAGGEKPEGLFDVVTAFEVVEHSAAPLETLDTLVSHMQVGGCIFVGQSMLPENIDRIGTRWWYIAPRNGHITFYSYRTISNYAAMRGLSCRSIAGGFLLHGPEISEPVSRFLEHYPPNPALNVFEALHVPKDAAGWHGIEWIENRGFRWTSLPYVPLGTIELQAPRTFISLPVAMVIDDRFWHESCLQVGAQKVALARCGNSLCVTIEVERASVEPMTLITLVPIRPSEHGGTDGRALGIALRVTDG